jgi:hypothetical protein
MTTVPFSATDPYGAPEFIPGYFASDSDLSALKISRLFERNVTSSTLDFKQNGFDFR